jgi:DNA-directed RNA polymerase specialized sigma24 family protein|tara:strand:- start:119 stop:316 length:198 start_codon:yes stop_codon:yes gene_type:complete
MFMAIKLKVIKAKKIINKMEEICREILMSITDYTTDEISSMLKIKPGTVLSRIHNCRKKLFRILA